MTRWQLVTAVLCLLLVAVVSPAVAFDLLVVAALVLLVAYGARLDRRHPCEEPRREVQRPAVRIVAYLFDQHAEEATK